MHMLMIKRFSLGMSKTGKYILDNPVGLKNSVELVTQLR